MAEQTRASDRLFVELKKQSDTIDKNHAELMEILRKILNVERKSGDAETISKFNEMIMAQLIEMQAQIQKVADASAVNVKALEAVKKTDVTSKKEKAEKAEKPDATVSGNGETTTTTEKPKGEKKPSDPKFKSCESWFKAEYATGNAEIAELFSAEVMAECEKTPNVAKAKQEINKVRSRGVWLWDNKAKSGDIRNKIQSLYDVSKKAASTSSADDTEE